MIVAGCTEPSHPAVGEYELTAKFTYDFSTYQCSPDGSAQVTYCNRIGDGQGATAGGTLRIESVATDGVATVSTGHMRTDPAALVTGDTAWLDGKLTTEATISVGNSFKARLPDGALYTMDLDGAFSANRDTIFGSVILGSFRDYYRGSFRAVRRR